MNNKYKHFIEGERIYLREVRLADVNENYYKWLNDPEINQFLETKYIPQSLESIRQYVERMNGNRDEIFLAICLKEDNRHIGNIKLGPINWYHRRGDISLFIGEKEYWKKGLGSEAIKLVTNFGFNILCLDKIEAGCFEVNSGSIKAFTKAGFTIEGTLTNHIRFKNKLIARICMGISNPGSLLKKNL